MGGPKNIKLERFYCIRKSQQTDKVENQLDPNVSNVLKVSNSFKELILYQSRSSGGL